MAGLLDMPKELFINHLFPLLGHNDILRLRRVCKTTKDLAHSYLWTPKKGHQGNWTLVIVPGGRDDFSLQAFLQMQLPPPSRVYIRNFLFDGKWDLPPRKMGNFFDDANLEEFMRIYSKYVTHFKITHIEIPFMSANEIRFYESLVNLENLKCDAITTEGAAKFNQRIQNDGSCLTPSTFKKVKCFKSFAVDCTTSFATFVDGLKCLERISGYLPLDFKLDLLFKDVPTNGIVFLRSLIERDVDNKLKFIDWIDPDWNWNPMEVLQLFVLCSDKGIKIRRFELSYLDVLLCNDHGVVDKTEIFDEDSREYVYRVNYQRYSFVGNVIHSATDNVNETVFLTELPYLEKLIISSTRNCTFHGLQRRGEPKWPNLRKLDINADAPSEPPNDFLKFLCERVERPKLEEFALRYNLDKVDNPELYPRPLPCPSNMARSFKNLKKLTLENCAGNSQFFVPLWEGLLLLEHVELLSCRNLGDMGLIGYSQVMGAEPVFLKLEKLKHLRIEGIHEMPEFTNRVFWEVFCRMKLSSLWLSGSDSGGSSKVSVTGIKMLLLGKFAESIERFDFNQLYLDGLSEDGRSELKSRFRSSKMR